MIRPSLSCDESTIEKFLNDELTLAEQDEFELHLSGCVPCRDRLQEVAAAPDIWVKVKNLLPASDSNSGMTVAADGTADSKPSAGLLSSLLPSDDPEMLGRIGEYEVSGVIGVGGMGAVLKGFDKSLRRVVAIKVMAPHLADSGSARSRFQREARAAAAITHDNVIEIYAVSENQGLPFIVMPFARGPSLQKRIDESGPLSTVETVRIGRQIASGLSAAHDQGLVHRDIKPANILLNDGIERLWITDFGVARAIDDASMTQTGVIAGTPLYMSPEQARGETVDHRSDLFSLGSILYTACTGRPPFRADSAYGILRRITDTDPRPIREVNPEVPDWLCRIVIRLMAKHPADRFHSAHEVDRMFADCLAHLQDPSHVKLPECITYQAEAAASESARAAAPDGRSLVARKKLFPLIATLTLLFGFGVAAMHWTQPADISGDWIGETWSTVKLTPAEEAAGWYTGAFTDAAGRPGVFQLDWSRLKRRYTGRWRIGDLQAGAITLRTAATGATVRGAISLDAESTAPPNVAWPRDFQWRKANESATAAVASTGGRSTVREIKSPTKGIISRVNPKVCTGATIKKGDLIAELRPFESSPNEEELSAAKARVDAAKRNLASKKLQNEAVSAIFTTLGERMALFQESERSTIALLEASVQMEQKRIEAARQEVETRKADLASKERTWQAAAKSVENKTGLRSIQELKQKRMDRYQATAKLSEAEQNLLQSGFKLKHAESRLAARQLGSEKLNQLKIDLAKAKADLVKSEGGVEEAKASLADAQRQHLDMKTKMDELQRLSIVAPFTGQVVSLNSLYDGAVVKEWDVICTIRLNKETAANNVNPAPQPRPQTPQQPPSVNQVLVENPTRQILAASTLEAFGTVSDLARRFRDADPTPLEAKLEDNRKQLDQVKKQLEEALERQRNAQPDQRPGQLRVKAQLKERELAAAESTRQELLAALEEKRELLAQANKEKETILALLKSRLQASEERLEINADSLSKRLSEAEAGAGLYSEEDLFELRQAVVTTKQARDELRILLEHYQQIGL